MEESFSSELLTSEMGCAFRATERRSPLWRKKFELPAEVEERAQRLHVPISMIKSDAFYNGLASVQKFLDQIEYRESLFQLWSPRLRLFAGECRKANPCPRFEDLSTKDKAKTEIIAEEMGRYRFGTSGWLKWLRICRLPLFAISTAERLVAPFDKECALLTSEEGRQWQQEISQVDKEFSILSHYYFEIQDPPVTEGTWFTFESADVPDGCQPWVAITGHCMGGLGGDCADLWAWNGIQATKIKYVGTMD